jgi:hypothetical protein
MSDSKRWRKATYSNGQGSCVEIGKNGGVLVRDTKLHGNGPVLRFSPLAWAAFTKSLKKLFTSREAPGRSL